MSRATTMAIAKRKRSLLSMIFLLPLRVSAASGSERVYISRRAQEATLATARGTDFPLLMSQKLRGRLTPMDFPLDNERGDLPEIAHHFDANHPPSVRFFFCFHMSYAS